MKIYDIDKFAEFINLTNGRIEKYNVYCDFVELQALLLSNLEDPIHREARQKRYEEIIEKYTQPEIERIVYYIQWLGEIIQRNVRAGHIKDILGYVYERHIVSTKGEEVTPESIAILCAKIANIYKQQIEQKGYVIFHDSFAGSGSMLLAAAEEAQNQGYDYKSQLVGFLGDKNRRYVHAAYVQASLYGIPAVISQTEVISLEESSRWYTPTYIKGNWVWRCPLNYMMKRNATDELLKMATHPMYAFIRNDEWGLNLFGNKKANIS